MKHAGVWLVSALLILGASCAAATEPEPVEDEPPGEAELSATAKVEIPEVFRLASPAEEKPGGEVGALGTSTADCGVTYPDVSCSGSTWSGVNRNCPAGEPGHVTCDGVTTSCPACACTEGEVRYSYVGLCCCDYTDDTHPVKRQLRYRQTCINGEWRDSGTVCNAGTCGGPGVCPV